MTSSSFTEMMCHQNQNRFSKTWLEFDLAVADTGERQNKKYKGEVILKTHTDLERSNSAMTKRIIIKVLNAVADEI